MKKTDLLGIVLIIFGLNTFVYGVINLSEQLVLLSSMSEDQSSPFLFMAIGGYSLASIIIFLIAYFLVFKSNALSKKIIRNDDDIDIQILLSKSDAIQIFLIIVSLFIIISRFPLFISSIYSLFSSFLSDYAYFKEFLPQNIGMIILYVFCFILLSNSKQISMWILGKTEKKIITGPNTRS